MPVPPAGDESPEPKKHGGPAHDDDPDKPLHSTFHIIFRGFAIWIFQLEEWILSEDHSAEGYEPCAPARPGDYEGEVVRVSSLKSASED
jgi:hypothetical protein